MAVVGLVFEVMGRESPTKSELVLKVKKTCKKRSNKRKVVRSGQGGVHPGGHQEDDRGHLRIAYQQGGAVQEEVPHHAGVFIFWGQKVQ